MVKLNDIIQFFKNYKRARMIRESGKLIPEQAVDFKFNGLSKKINPSVKMKINDEFGIEKNPTEIDEFYNSYTQERIDEIHSRGMLTPAEKVAEWEGNGLCAPGDAVGSASGRCQYFTNQCGTSGRCHECLREFGTHHDEYHKIEFKLVNRDENVSKIKEIKLNA